MKQLLADGKDHMMSEKHRTGRPLKDHPPGTQVTITLQVPAELKSKLQSQALNFNRTLSQEAQHRLERSFDFKAQLEDAIRLAVEDALARTSERLAAEHERLRIEQEQRVAAEVERLRNSRGPHLTANDLTQHLAQLLAETIGRQQSEKQQAEAKRTPTRGRKNDE
jgi:hypothetical protein